MRGVRLTRSFLRKAKWRVTFVLAAVLIVVIAGAWFLSEKRSAPKLHSLDIYQGEHLSASMSQGAFAYLTMQEIQHEGVLYSGVSLGELLIRESTAPTAMETVRCANRAGAIVDIPGSDVSTRAFVLTLREEKEIPVSEGGPYILLTEDDHGTRSTLASLVSIKIMMEE